MPVNTLKRNLTTGRTEEVSVLQDGDAVNLQATTPGSPQTGHLNVSGTIRAGTDIEVNGNSLNPSPKNWIQNGDMEVNQRKGPGGSVAGAINGDYGCDRWQLIRDGSGATASFGQVAFTIGQTAVPNEPSYYLHYAQTVAGSGGTYLGFQQNIEDVKTLAGQVVTVSFWAKADAARVLSLRLRQQFGSGGSAAFDTTAQVYNLTTSWAQYFYTTTVPSITGKTIGAANSLMPLWLTGSVNLIQSIDIAQVQLEIGANAGPYQKRSFAEEKRDCMRYFQKSFPYATAVAQNVGNNVGSLSWIVILAGAVVTPAQGVRLPVPMRTVPTVVFYNPFAANAFARNLQTSTDSTTMTSGGSSNEEVLSVACTGLAAWAVNQNICVHYTLSDPNF